jgi:AraC-like DNA-binding protein
MNQQELSYYPHIKDYLKASKLADKQKHPNFHIINFQEHIDIIPFNMGPYKIGMFMLTLSNNDDGNLSVSETTYQLNEESLSINTPGQIISYNGIEDKHEGTDYMILFDPQFLSFLNNNYDVYKAFPFFNINSCPVYSLETEDAETLRFFFKKIYDEFKNVNEDNIEIIRSYLTILLFESKKLLRPNYIKTHSNDRFEEITNAFEQLIKQTENKRNPINYYADLLNISTVYLSECVKKSTGKTAKQIIKEYCLLEAKALLSQSNQTILSIAYQIGFEDQSNFIKFFKKETGLTPGQFRSKPNF